MPHLSTTPAATDPDASVPIRCELRCNRCGRTATYEVPWATIHPHPEQYEADGWDGILLGRVIACRACGVEDEYTVSALSKVVMVLRAMAAARHRGESGDARDARVQFAVAQLGDGTVIRRPSQAIAHLRALTQAQPESGEAWRRLGNAYERYEQLAEAEEAWRKAIQVDSAEFEAAFSLAKVHFDDDRFVEAFAFLSKAIDRFPTAKGMTVDFRDTVASCMADYLKAVIERTDEAIALMASWSGGEPLSGRPVVYLSSIDLRRVRDWGRLARFIAGTGVLALRLTPELPSDEVTQLDALLHGGLELGMPMASRPTPHVRSSARVGRNDPCPCGSGKKFKKCCAP